jgi:hypothetical protein
VHVDASRKLGAPIVKVSKVADLGWQKAAKWRKPVCLAQQAYENGGVACTPIAMLASLSLMSKPISEIDWENDVMKAGARIWVEWCRTRTGSSSFMLPGEVTESSDVVRGTVHGLQLAIKEIGGLLSDSPDENENHYPFASAIALIESEAAEARFAAVLTCGIFSLAVVHVGAEYYVFDSHGDTVDALGGSTLVMFRTLMDLAEAMQLRFKDCGELYSLYALVPRRN